MDKYQPYVLHGMHQFCALFFRRRWLPCLTTSCLTGGCAAFIMTTKRLFTWLVYGGVVSYDNNVQGIVMAIPLINGRGGMKPLVMAMLFRHRMV